MWMSVVDEFRAVAGRSCGRRVVLNFRWNIRGLLMHELIHSANVNVNARVEMDTGAAEESP